MNVNNVEHKLEYFETNLQAVMDHFVKGFDGHVSRYNFFINPINHKVIFELFIKSKQDEREQSTTPPSKG